MSGVINTPEGPTQQHEEGGKLMWYLSLLCLSCSEKVGGKSSTNLTIFGYEKTLLWYLPFTIGDFSDQSTSDLGGKSSVNLTYFGREKTWLWYLPSIVGYVIDQGRWQKFGLTWPILGVKRLHDTFALCVMLERKKKHDLRPCFFFLSSYLTVEF